METTLCKWGNSSAVRVPAEVCDELGISLGDHASIEVDPERATLVLRFERSGRRYARTRRMSMEEFAADRDGTRVGTEWGGPDVGSEAVS